MAYGESNIVINVYLAPVVGQGATFSTVLYLVDEAQGTGNALNGDRFRTYNSTTDVDDDETAGYITAEVAQALTDGFAQRPIPQEILVGRVDTGGAEGYDDGLAACIAAGAEFYGVALDKRTATEILEVSAALEGYDFYISGLQSADADWLTVDYPATLTALENRERSCVAYHDIAAENMALCWMVDRLNVDPDYLSGAFEGNVNEVAAYTTALTAGQLAFAEGNEVNVLCEFGTSNSWVSGGWNCAARPIDHIVTADWFKTRLRERLIARVAEKAAKHEKINVDPSGSNETAGIISGLLSQGEAANHFVKDQTRVTPITPDATDIAAKRLRFTVEGQLTTNARVFQVNVYLGTTALPEAA